MSEDVPKFMTDAREAIDKAIKENKGWKKLAVGLEKVPELEATMLSLKVTADRIDQQVKVLEDELSAESEDWWALHSRVELFCRTSRLTILSRFPCGGVNVSARASVLACSFVLVAGFGMCPVSHVSLATSPHLCCA